ncbi:MAG: hypothetical protein IJW65_06205 [Clostridia bacterium]|nr:hypothetical protein [Clostridia bacterium]
MWNNARGVWRAVS